MFNRQLPAEGQDAELSIARKGRQSGLCAVANHSTSLAMLDDVPDALRSELARLRAEQQRFELLTRHLSASAALQGLRSGAQGYEAHELRRQIMIMQSSTIWRATFPLRLALDLLRGRSLSKSTESAVLRALVKRLRSEGWRGAFARVGGALARPRRARVLRKAKPAAAASTPAALRKPCEILAQNVLIIAELTLPQCAKYRVWQKQELFGRLGVPCRVVDWRFTDDCLSAAALATQVILYRVPGYKAVMMLIDSIHALGLPVSWEVDDLIFDDALFLQNRNIDDLDEELREGIVSGVDLYRSAMLACGSGIASTPCLARIMREAGLAEVAVVENALDEETLGIAESLRRARRRQAAPGEDSVLVTYGSGTKTHNADFRQAAPALLRLLQEFPQTRLRIVGELTLPEEFAAFGERVQRLPPTPFPRYLALLAESDINLAPLEPTLFNDAKSNIKFLEGAILGLPSVCSPRAHFTDVIRHGENGLLAESEQEWFESLAALVRDAALRTRLGEAALQTALQHYDPYAIANTQLAPLLLRAPDARPAAALRVIFANVYYAPRSFGGATIVVEEMARHLKSAGDVDVHVVTSLGPDATARALHRTEQDGIAVYELPVSHGDVVADFNDPPVGHAFGHILDAVQPDIVHLHAVQKLSASLAAACLERHIPYVITLHDSWWLCARQFMVREDGKYCFQKRIDLRVCQNCVPGARHLEHRDTILRTILDGAALLLSPSETHRQLYIANGISADKIEVSPNGIRLPPASGPARRRGAKLRFAYVGGPVDVKGFRLVKGAFEALERTDWELILVDNTQKLGFSSSDGMDLDARGTVTIRPDYSQDEMEAFFAGLDVLLFPSQWKESFGLTVREALARGVWVIATDGGAPSEIIVDGMNGNLIPLDGRPEALRQAVEGLLDHPELLDGFANPPHCVFIDYAAQADALRRTLERVVDDTRASRTE